MLKVLPLNTNFKNYVNHYYDNGTQMYIKLPSGYHPIEEGLEDSVKSLICGLEIKKTQIDWYYRNPVIKETPILSVALDNKDTNYEVLFFKIGVEEIGIYTQHLRSNDIEYLIHQLEQLKNDMPA